MSYSTSPLQARGEGLENAYFHCQSTLYRLLSHRTKIFALQVADTMGMSIESAQSYATSLVELYAETCDDNTLIERALSDLRAKGIGEHRLVLERHLSEADLRADEDFY